MAVVAIGYRDVPRKLYVELSILEPLVEMVPFTKKLFSLPQVYRSQCLSSSMQTRIVSLASRKLAQGIVKYA